MNFGHIYKQIDTGKSIYYAWFEAMHTRIDIALCNLTEEKSTHLTGIIHSEIKRIEKFSNRFDPESEISRINQLACKTSLRISEELYSILQNCIEYNRKTNGIFDITIQSKSNYRNGINNITLNPIHKTIFFLNENVQIDLCGYIKGYALDKIKEILTQNKCNNALINMGNSSVLGMGNHPFGKGWKVKTAFSRESGMVDKEVILYNQFLTTSGNETKNRKHIIHPVTGEYTEGFKTTSVLTDSGAEGEVYSLTYFLQA